MKAIVLVSLSGFIKGGWGVHPDSFVELDFAIAVDQQTRARKRTFEGVPDPGAHRFLRDSRAHNLSFFSLILPNNLNMLNTKLWGGLFVANYLLNIYI